MIELSIALVILGLLVGGILGGMSLIRAAEMRHVMVEYEQWQTKIRNFRIKYHALPGDFSQATRFWGRVPDGQPIQCDSPARATGDGTQTCNGNGDGEVQGNTSHERYRLWQHLANAGLITGRYTGVAGGNGGQHHVPDVNMPLSKISGLSWSFENDGADRFGNGNPDSFFWYRQGSLYHVLGLGQPSADNDTIHGFDAFTPSEVWSVDSKPDDGKPGSGRVQTVFRAVGACTTAADTRDYVTADYNLESDKKQCNILFPNAL